MAGPDPDAPHGLDSGAPPGLDSAAVAGLDLTERRLAFGRVAELYDRARPHYPAEVFDELIRFGGLARGDRVLEVGAGTGKATVALAQRGLAVLALEPDGAMAAVWRRNCAPYEQVAIECVEFERFRAREPFAALVCAQAWHWLDPAQRYARAAEALRPGGALAAVWTFPRWEAVTLREPLREAYRRCAPELAAGFPMHPASHPLDFSEPWRLEVQASGAFVTSKVSSQLWSRPYSASEYVALLETHQDHILLDSDTRARLMQAVAAVLDEQAGGTIALELVTQLCLARRGESR